MNTLTDRDRLVIHQAINGDPRFFSICPVTNACKMLDIEDFRDRRAYQLLDMLHCQEYRNMSPELIALLPQLVEEALAPPEPKPSWFTRLRRALVGK